MIIGDPNLEAEKSTSYEVAALWENGDVALGATYFYTDFKDKISNALVLNPDGTPGAKTATTASGIITISTMRSFRVWN